MTILPTKRTAASNNEDNKDSNQQNVCMTQEALALAKGTFRFHVFISLLQNA